MTAVETEVTPYILNHFIGGKTRRGVSGVARSPDPWIEAASWWN